MTRTSSLKLTAIALSGRLPIIPTLTLAADTTSQHEEGVNPSLLSDLIAPVVHEGAAVFSPSIESEKVISNSITDRINRVSTTPNLITDAMNRVSTTPNSSYKDVSEEIHIPSILVNQGNNNSNPSIF